MASSSSSPLGVVPTKKGEWKYDVFLSHAHENRNNFVDHLYADLVDKGARVFKYDVMVGIGESESQEIVKAIKESRFAVVVFSKYYAKSHLCLGELSRIMECRTQMDQTVLPVFYHIDPSDVREQNGDVETAFEHHERKFRGEMDKLKKWREALTAAANLNGHHILPDNGGESAFKKKIVQRILPNAASFTSIQFTSILKAAASSFSSSSPWKNDVFLCFGEDTRNNFTDHLYDALVEKGNRVLKHDEMQPISKDDIEESRFAVVVFSKNFAKSRLCLEELSMIMECRTQMGQPVVPVYYHITKYAVCEEFETAFKKPEEKFRGEVDKVKKWWKALNAAVNLNGHQIPDNGYESEIVKEIVRRIFFADVEMNGGKIIGDLCVLENVIGKGSKDTVVVEGFHGTRPAAVKRFLKKHHDVASKEIQNLKDSDHLPNIVRYYGVENDKDFVYIVLERCICSLYDLILSQPNPTLVSQLTSEERESFKVGEPIGYPSPELLKVMRDTAGGLLIYMNMNSFTET